MNCNSGRVDDDDDEGPDDHNNHEGTTPSNIVENEGIHGDSLGNGVRGNDDSSESRDDGSDEEHSRHGAELVQSSTTLSTLSMDGNMRQKFHRSRREIVDNTKTTTSRKNYVVDLLFWKVLVLVLLCLLLALMVYGCRMRRMMAKKRKMSQQYRHGMSISEIRKSFGLFVGRGEFYPGTITTRHQNTNEMTTH